MTKIVTFLMVLTSSALAKAAPDYSTLAKKLYSTNVEDQAFVSKFFDILEAHKTRDPLLEAKGPSIRDYSVDKIKFALITNITSTTVDLTFFNWKLPSFQGLELDPSLSRLYGSNVYTLKNMHRKSIASQGKNRSQLTNFSYMLGANTMEKQIKRGAPAGYQVPEEYLNWKPHPEYMDRSAPLRQALDANSLTILSPNKDVFFEGAGITPDLRSFMENHFSKAGGYINMIMGVMFHEMFHVKEGEDQINNFAVPRNIGENRKEIANQLKANERLRLLMATYAKIVFSIGDSLKNKAVGPSERQQLADLNTIILELKNTSTEAWKFIWDYEYTEGFAEYVSAYSMVQGGIVTLEQKIELEKNDGANNFTYRTGAIGGLYLANRIQEMPFGNQEDHRESVWEIILRKSQIQAGGASANEIIAKYSSGTLDGENEVKRVIDYLVSTIMEMK